MEETEEEAEETEGDIAVRTKRRQTKRDKERDEWYARERDEGNREGDKGWREGRKE